MGGGGGTPFFDTDPCASMTQPWPCAKTSYNAQDDGFARAWDGKVWCNPPYGPHTEKWMQRMAKHGNGIALVYARTETVAWQQTIFPTASAIVFVEKRIAFCYPDGREGKASGAPSAFIAWGAACKYALRRVLVARDICGAYTDNVFSSKLISKA